MSSLLSVKARSCKTRGRADTEGRGNHGVILHIPIPLPEKTPLYTNVWSREQSRTHTCHANNTTAFWGGWVPTTEAWVPSVLGTRSLAVCSLSLLRELDVPGRPDALTWGKGERSWVVLYGREKNLWISLKGAVASRGWAARLVREKGLRRTWTGEQKASEQQGRKRQCDVQNQPQNSMSSEASNHTFNCFCCPKGFWWGVKSGNYSLRAETQYSCSLAHNPWWNAR